MLHLQFDRTTILFEDRGKREVCEHPCVTKSVLLRVSFGPLWSHNTKTLVQNSEKNVLKHSCLILPLAGNVVSDLHFGVEIGTKPSFEYKEYTSVSFVVYDKP